MKRQTIKEKMLKLNYEIHLDVLLLDSNTIIGNEWKISEIEKLLDNIEQNNPEILQESVNKVKDAIQQEAEKTWIGLSWGLLTMATGVGKSKVAINIAAKGAKALGIRLKILLVVPTEKLRDENWKNEFTKWGFESIYHKNITRVCYASLGNIADQEYDLVIGDEFHNVTLNNSEFFKQNKIHRFIGLTATPPTDLIKLQILKALKIPTVYNVPLDIAVRLKLVAPYDITIVECRLDDVTKNILSGTKTAPFMTTEKKAYDYKTTLVNQAMYMPAHTRGKVTKFRILDRMRFIKNLESRTKNAKFILEKFIKPDERVLIFCGGIDQAELICPQSFHSKTNDRWLKEFINKLINRLSCVAALNEGVNISEVNTAFIVAVESGDKTLTQQIGRAIRFTIGHRARIIILVYTDTVDEKWSKSALINLDPSKIRYVRMANLVAGVDTI